MKKVYLWASPDTCSKASDTSRWNAAGFSGTHKTIAVPSGNRVITLLPREHHCLVKNGSFGDCFVEGTYLYSDSATPCIWMFSIALQRKIKVQDLESYPLQFPFKDPKIHAISSPILFNSLSKTQRYTLTLRCVQTRTLITRIS